MTAVSDPTYLLYIYWQGTLELPDLTLQKGSVKLLKERWESASALRPSLALQRLPAPRSTAPEKSSHGSTIEKVPADSGRVDVFKEEPLGGPRWIEPFPITVKELQSRFETLGGRKVSAWARADSSREWKWALRVQGGFLSLTWPLFSAPLGMGNAGGGAGGLWPLPPWSRQFNFLMNERN